MDGEGRRGVAARSGITGVAGGGGRSLAGELAGNADGTLVAVDFATLKREEHISPKIT